MAHDHHCPHCLSLVASDEQRLHPVVPEPCPSCRLLIGAGRSRSPEQIVGLGRSAAAAAGFMAATARRADVAPAAPAAVLDDLLTVAEARGLRIERLRMTDYDGAQSGGAVENEVAVVLSTFGSWKAARAAAAARAAGSPQAEDVVADSA